MKILTSVFLVLILVQFSSIPAHSTEYDVGDNLFLNACTGNPDTYENKPLNINKMIVEVPNVVTEVKTSPYGRSVIVKATSTMQLDDKRGITATLNNFRDFSISGDNGEVLYERRVSGATSIYELKHHGKVLGWGVGWHKTCKEYYDDTDFTVLRVLIPNKTHGHEINIANHVFRGVAQSSFLEAINNSSGFILVHAADIVDCGACTCYYCLPQFYLIDNRHGINQISDLKSLKAMRININHIEPSLYLAWLASHRERKALAEFVSKNFDKIVPSELAYAKWSEPEKYDERKIRGRKISCLAYIENEFPVIKKIGEKCFPVLEEYGYFDTR